MAAGTVSTWLAPPPPPPPTAPPAPPLVVPPDKPPAEVPVAQGTPLVPTPPTSTYSTEPGLTLKSALI
jgi:hypothetical protein